MDPVRDKSSVDDCRTLKQHMKQKQLLPIRLILGQRLFTSVSYL